MKTLLILILSSALLAAAFFTRPSKESFSSYYRMKKLVSENTKITERLLRESERDKDLSSLTFTDEMAKDDKAQYIGAFSHWFDKSDPAGKPIPAAPSNERHLPDHSSPLGP